MNTVKQQFDHISKKYDAQREQLIPCFRDFYTAGLPVIKSIINAKTVLDLGAGTGLFSWFVYEQNPALQFTLADLSVDMLDVARRRFNGLNNFSFMEFDFSGDDLSGKFDIIISALAIHHLEDNEKENLYHKVYHALNPGGLFINADQVSGRTPLFDSFYKNQWNDTVLNSGLDDDAINRAFERIKLDKFALLETQLQMLEKTGFTEVDCIYKNLNFVVFGGVKPAL
ncbi:class I SAM-dependent methyltransferase [Mucilaginibacter sp. SP1R1]|uniref:class I SAM-dependent methyltransferase n=1 Tax=Mucilaginibacter sp. SP1R1 TaxID=2723091 RepID=UPI00160CC86D|nr:class I SAM-dependent methyltransferase [Mucilaginibacter sp. SP1R1]MBB6148223.1 tRNA (cmo5U34)-methyltransferase [Mucilaginibacter sp. SP1R1]